MDTRDPGQRAYEAYSAAGAGETSHGDSLPPWELLTETIRDKWRAAAAAVLPRAA